MTPGVAIEDNFKLTDGIKLSQNYPNPFYSNTNISYQLEKSGGIILNIYNLCGQLVKKLVHSRETVGKHSIVWDGRDESGKKVPDGIYFCELITEGKSIVKKMLFLR